MAVPLRVGLYSPYFGATVGGGEKYLALTATFLRDAFPEHVFELFGPVRADPGRYERAFAVDLSGIALGATNRRVTPLHRGLNRLAVLRPLRDRVLGSQAGRATAGYDLFVSMAYAIPVRSRARRGAVLCQFPYELSSARDLDGYERVVCQSEYVRGWVRRRWGRDAAVVNPPIDVPAEEPDWERKERIVLSVGRFVASGHVKRQDLMVESFGRLLGRGLRGWELHLAGSVHHDGVHAGCFDRVVEMARGLPVHFHPDASYAEVQDLYRRASVYWHAAGCGVDEEADPAALEHFGMTTAEAMAHGVVPVAIGRGGQPEVVSDGRDGYLWREPSELEARTLEVAGDAALRRSLGQAARRSSRRLSRGRFATEIVAALGDLLQGPEVVTPARDHLAVPGNES